MADTKPDQVTWWDLLAELLAAFEAYKAATDATGRDRAEERYRRATQAFIDYRKRHEGET